MHFTRVFEYDGMREVRAQLIDGEPWLLMSDAMKVLDLTNATEIARRLDPSDLRTFNTIEGIRKDARWVNESGLYDLILDSRKPEAKAFSSVDVFPGQ